jgi:hypothetical protein
VLTVNLALFLPVVIGGIAMSWFGWALAGRGGEDDAGGGGQSERGPAAAAVPVGPSGSAGPDDLARSA